VPEPLPLLPELVPSSAKTAVQPSNVGRDGRAASATRTSAATGRATSLP
jgi:hypothetical protein